MSKPRWVFARAGAVGAIALLSIPHAIGEPVPMTSQGAESADTVLAEATRAVAKLQALVPRWRPLSLPAGAGELALSATDSLTIADLRDVDLDPNPPALRPRTVTYAPSQADDCPAGARPYIARGIRPFRLREFTCEFSYGGWHNFDMQDYAAVHGFSVLYPYVRKDAEFATWPADTVILRWGGFVDWHTWLPRHDIPDGRYDLLAGLDLVKMHLDSGVFRHDPAAAPAGGGWREQIMIDMEHPVLAPEALRKKDWYPADANEADRAGFEKKYYDGYAQTYVSAVAAARAAGWHDISIYGWAPYGRTWGGLERAEVDPGTDQAWNAFGRAIHASVDIINNSVYCFYWSPQNVAYTLASIDLNRKLTLASGAPKPLRPYYWTLLHGGGGGWRWWREQPLPDEEMRAMTALAFFAGIDGIVSWNWSGTGSHHTVALRTRNPRPAKPTKDADSAEPEWQMHDVQIGGEFTAKADGGNTEEAFRRYDVLHMLSVNEPEGTARFQKIRPGTPRDATAAGQPEFSLPLAQLLPRLRAKSAPVAAQVEGLALVKPLEFLLRHGEVRIDVPAQEQFAKRLPLVRRVQLGPWHVVATYDPMVVHGGVPREVVLADFAGVPGRTLRLPADAETRIFVLHPEPGP